MTKVVAGAVVAVGECGNDDVTSANLMQMADTLATRPPTDEDRRELVVILRWLANLVRAMEQSVAPKGRRRPPLSNRRLAGDAGTPRKLRSVLGLPDSLEGVYTDG